MTEPDGREPALPTAAGIPSDQPRLSAQICPFLMADGGWRAAVPAREHRCSAVEPPARLATDKQRRLCLTSDHMGCATFVAAREARAGMLPRGEPVGRPVARTAPLVLERARPLVPIDRLGDPRRWGQVALVALMILAIVAVAIARSGGQAGSGSDGGIGGTSPSVGTTPSTAATPPRATPTAATSVPVTSPATGPGESTAPGVAPTNAPSPAAPSPRQTYTVKRGDTLSAIATRFGTTVLAIRQLNDISNPSLIRVGQVLQIP